MCQIISEGSEGLWGFGIKVFVLTWIVFVPIAITARLEKIIHLLKEQQGKK